MFVVEYPCDRFCRIEVDLTSERGQVTLQQMREKAEGLHRRVHEPDLADTDAEAAVVAPETAGRPAATVFLSAPGRAGDRSTPGRTGDRSAHGRAGDRRR
jgi:hypothetical protein